MQTRVSDSWFGQIRVGVGEDYEQRRPRWKVRGRRRYYRALERDAARFSVSDVGWYDYMHWHVDWWGTGNLSWRERRSHLAALFTMFRRLLAQTDRWEQPHQCWLLIDPGDSSQDAVYLHTPNPNGRVFPAPLDEVRWDAEIPARLRELITEPDWQFGRADESGTYFCIRRRPTV